MYYSFVTPATMGYGDIMPVHPLARAVAVLEALTGQLYLAIMLARLVSLELQPGGTAERSTTDGLEGAANNGVVPARRVISVDRPVHLPVDGGGVPA